MNTARIKENRVYKFFFNPERKSKGKIKAFFSQLSSCLLYTSDAADDYLTV